MPYTEFTMSVDEFQNPKTYKDAKAIMILLTRLALLEPGTIQSHPEMGLGLYSRYAYSMEGIEDQLRSDYQRQIQKYLPQFQGANVIVRRRDKNIAISVEIDQNLYGIYYDIQSSAISSKYTRLSEL